MIRSRGLSDTQLRALRRELEGACERYDEHDARHYAAAAALQRMDGGSYGSCVRCGDAIPFGRLSVLPETRHCVTCGGRRRTVHDYELSFTRGLAGGHTDADGPA